MSIDSVGIVGAGTMGRGIAQVCAASGLSVTLCDIALAPLRQALVSIERAYARLVERERMSEADKDAALARLKTSTVLTPLANAELIVEAATENPQVKLELFARLGEVCGAEVILTSNTSSISLTKIAAAAAHPERVVGMHFFNPVPVMKLIEVTRALQTSDATFETVRGLAERLGKVAVATQDSPGFVVNRLLIPMINEAVVTLSEGVASAEEIDVAMRQGANHPMGPLALADLIGLDVCLSVMEVLHEQFGEAKYRPVPLLRKMVDAGYLGRKSGKGFFEYG